MLTATKELFTRPSEVSYQISRSVRLRASATAYLNRTFTTPTNNIKWSWSGWVKRGALSSQSNLFTACDSGATNFFFVGFDSTTNSINFAQTSSGTYNLQGTTAAVFRDPAAWYHVVVVYDSANATSTDRFIIYINGVRQTLTYSVGPFALNTVCQINSARSTILGALFTTSAIQLFDGYMTEINFIDGQALTASSFGSTNAVTGVWQPIKYTGTYGTNGFYLNFSDNSGNTATTIGKDNSGNGNNWTPNNISVTTGVTYDSMLDVPTLYADTGNGRGNYPVMNPLVVTSYTYAYGNLAITNSVANWFNTRATIPFGSTGKFYYEQVCTAGANCWAAIGNENTLLSGNPAGYDANSYGYGNNGNKYFNSVATAYGSTFTTNDVIGVAFDAATGSVWFAKNGTWQASGNPAAGTNYAFTGITGTMFPIGSSSGSGAAVAQVYNFGQSPFTYTPPTGFVALNTQNLSAPTISNGAAYMAATLYTGTNATASISNAVNSISFQPDLIWIKTRSTTGNNGLVDSIRGNYKVLFSNLTGPEQTNTAGTGVTAFSSNGFTLGTDPTTSANMNANGTTYVAWQWKAGTTSSSNTSGSLTTTVSVNASAGFSVVTYTGAGGVSTIGHGLGVAPSMMIFKDRDGAANNWPVYHKSLGNTSALLLDTTGASTATTNWWSNTSPTSSVATIGSNETNTGNKYVAYCFSEVAGYSKIGSWQNNNSTDGTFVYLGFRPRFLLLKCTDAAESWYIEDSSRQTYNYGPGTTNFLLPNLANAEQGGQSAATAGIDFLSNGFKIRTTNPASGEIGFGTRNYIFMAVAENPFKYSLAR